MDLKIVTDCEINCHDMNIPPLPCLGIYLTFAATILTKARAYLDIFRKAKPGKSRKDAKLSRPRDMSSQELHAYVN